jgi:hypothetical protein
MKATQLNLFEIVFYDYSQLSIHQRINFKSWNRLPTFEHSVYFTIENSIDRITKWSPKPTTNSVEVNIPSPYTKSIFGY